MHDLKAGGQTNNCMSMMSFSVVRKDSECLNIGYSKISRRQVTKVRMNIPECLFAMSRGTLWFDFPYSLFYWGRQNKTTVEHSIATYGLVSVLWKKKNYIDMDKWPRRAFASLLECCNPWTNFKYVLCCVRDSTSTVRRQYVDSMPTLWDSTSTVCLFVLGPR